MSSVSQPSSQQPSNDVNSSSTALPVKPVDNAKSSQARSDKGRAPSTPDLIKLLKEKVEKGRLTKEELDGIGIPPMANLEDGSGSAGSNNDEEENGDNHSLADCNSRNGNERDGASDKESSPMGSRAPSRSGDDKSPKSSESARSSVSNNSKKSSVSRSRSNGSAKSYASNNSNESRSAVNQSRSGGSENENESDNNGSSGSQPNSGDVNDPLGFATDEDLMDGEDYHFGGSSAKKRSKHLNIFVISGWESILFNFSTTPPPTTTTHQISKK